MGDRARVATPQRIPIALRRLVLIDFRRVETSVSSIFYYFPLMPIKANNKSNKVAFLVQNDVKTALERKLVELNDLCDQIKLVLKGGKVNANFLNDVLGPNALELCADAELVHVHYNDKLSDESKALLENDLQSFDEKDSCDLRLRDELLITQSQVMNILYGVFAAFGTGAAIYLALSLFSDLIVEWKMIAAIVAATIISITELIYLIKYVC